MAPGGIRRITAGVLVSAAVAGGCGIGGDGNDAAPARPPSGDVNPAPPTARALVWAVGDGANGSRQARVLARRMARSKPDLLIYLGDVYEHGTATEFADNYATVYGRLSRRTAPTPGNHDWPQHAEGYDPYWTRAMREPVPSWYAFSIAGWRILSLNSETAHDPGSPQVRWLRRQVAGPGNCRLAFWHRPRFSAGTKHGDQPDVAPFWDALRGHARIVLNGHEHDMQRLQPRGGIVEFVSGAGGAARYPVDPAYPGLAFANDSDWGALRLELRRGTARTAFVTRDGEVLDRTTITCRRR